MNKPYNIVEGVFYITNVCNLTCNRCMTYNDRKFKGHFHWSEYKDHYVKWSKLLDIDRISILGGEPYANSELLTWATEIRKLWIDCKDINVCTNGTYLKNNIELSRYIIQQDIWLDVCVHDPALYNEIKDALEETLSIFKFTKKTTGNHDIGFFEFEVEEYYLNDRLISKLSKQWNFSKNSTSSIVNNTTFMHTSDPVRAHDNCAAKFCHYFVKGKLYKCFLTGVGRGLVDQFAIDDSAANLLTSYNSCSAFDPEQQIEEFIYKLKEHIPQCSLCPEKRTSADRKSVV